MTLEEINKYMSRRVIAICAAAFVLAALLGAAGHIFLVPFLPSNLLTSPVHWLEAGIDAFWILMVGAFAVHWISRLDLQRKQVAERILRLNEILRLIRFTSQLIVEGDDETQLLQKACDRLVDGRNYQMAWIGLTRDGSYDVLPVAQTGTEEGYLSSVKTTWDDSDYGRGPTGTAIKTGQPAIMRDIFNDPQYYPWREQASKGGYRSSIALPLIVENRVIGALNIFSGRPDAFDDEEVSLFAELARDMSLGIEKMREREERKQAEELYLVMANSSQIGVYIVQDKKFRFVNPYFLRAVGFGEDELSGADPLAIVHPEDREMVRENAVKMLKGERSEPCEYRVIDRDGNIKTALEAVTSVNYGGRRAVLGSWVDITERKRAEEGINKAAEEWRTTFDSITDLVSIHDKDFKLVRVNKAFADTFKTEPKELLGRTCYEIIHGIKEPYPNCPHKQTLETKKSAMVELFEPRSGVHLQMSTSPIFNDQGEVVGTVHIAKDITERKKMEEQLIITDRLASVGELASGIAHELNNPLTSVIGFSQLLLERGVADDVKKDVQVICSEAQRAADVVKNLLTFARKHTLVKQPINVNSIIEKVLELRAYEQRVNNIQVNTQFAPDLPEILADYFELQQVFLNITINAEHFMIEARNRGTLDIITGRVDDTIKVLFIDDGPGIPEENLGHLFDPFFTTKEVGDGTGLGLSICHGIITGHGGRIYAESELGKGATFVVELPISND